MASVISGVRKQFGTHACVTVSICKTYVTVTVTVVDERRRHKHQQQYSIGWSATPRQTRF